jgi:protein-tyrosine phosphatase
MTDLCLGDPADLFGAVDDPRRRVAIAGMFNLRDVGGYATTTGGVTRWRTLLRGDAPHQLTEGCRAVLAQIGIRLVIDLRSRDELRRAPAAWGRLPLAVVHRPVYSVLPDDAHWADDPAGIYRSMVTAHGRQLTGAVMGIAQSGGMPTLVHCSAGKDRTGIVIALALTAVGVAEHDVIADYTLTSRYLHAGAGAALRKLFGSTGDPMDPALLACPPELLADTLQLIRAEYGGVQEFLLHNGATRADLGRLRQLLVASTRNPS